MAQKLASRLGLFFHGRLIFCALLALCVVAATGCVTDASKQIGAFSQAAITTADNTIEAFDLVEKVHYRCEVSNRIRVYNTNGFDNSPIQAYMTPTNLEVRLEVLNGLKLYAANLSSLLGNSALTNLDLATTHFGQALISVDTSLVKDAYFKKEPVSEADLRIFAAAVNAIGHWVIEHEQNKDAQKAIAEMQPHVTNLCRLFHKDFEILGKQVQNDLNDTIQYKDDTILKNWSYFAASPGEKRAEIEEMCGLVRERQDDLELFDSMQSAADTMQKAHEALGQVFSDDKANINSLITEFSAEAKRISKYYSSLKTSK